MTWTKLGAEFFDDCAEAGLSDAAVRTHVEAIGYLYGQENFDLTLKKSTMRRWAGSTQSEQAALELVAIGMWIDGGSVWTVVHHADVIRQSLAAQITKREYDKQHQRKKRQNPNSKQQSNVVNDIVSDDVTTQTDRQTGIQTEERLDKEQAEHSEIDVTTGEVFSLMCRCGEPLNTAVQREHGKCNRCYVTDRAAASWGRS